MHDFIVEARGVSKRFQGFTAVNGVNLRVREGEIHALIGPNGAGKSTLFNLLTRFLPLSAGQVLYRGRDVSACDPADMAQLGVVRSFQISAVFPHLSVRDNVRVALQRRHGPIYRFWSSARSLARLHERCDALLAEVGLLDQREARAVDLSYGRRRALELATTLAMEPQLMLLDEPMAGIGHESIDFIADLIQRVAVGRTVLMVEHNLQVVERLSHRVTVLSRGEVLAEGRYDEVARDPAVRAAYMGGVHV